MIAAMADAVLAVHDVWKHYGPSAALAGVTLAVRAGEVFGLLGPNGAGKTTLLSILAGLTDPSRGSVTLFGKSLTRTDRDLRRQIGLATQDLAIYPELTARENLAFFGRLYGLDGTSLAARIRELLTAVGLTDRADDRAGTFSGGMKRRLNLAVAVVHSPRILLLDEPTTGVDPQSRVHIFDHVKALNAAGLSIVYTSHYMEEVQTLCTRIAILDGGQVQACDTLPNLLRTEDAIARVRLAAVPPGLADRVAALPGVKECRTTADGLDVVANDLGPVLPGLVAACTAAGATPTAIDLDPPTLERVFLHLTGRGLRD
jgi:ABC-2 type transport system ATP-binding protein